jgi:hypothetical protein
MPVWKTFALLLAAGLGPGLIASQMAAPAPAKPASITVPSQGSVVGAAWNADSTGIPGARLRLRNISSGKIVAAATADDQGQFRFDKVPAGAYVIELVDEAGKVLALGHMFSLASGETLATFVRLGTRVPWVAGFFSNAAVAVISSAASQGLTALAPVARPVSRKQ